MDAHLIPAKANVDVNSISRDGPSMAKVRISLRRIAILLLSSMVALFCLLVFVLGYSKPPSERKLMDSFYAHRAAYERLRDMLQEDEQLFRLASWGVETTNSGPHHVQPGGDFPVDRYEQYLALLNQTGGRWVSRDRGKNPEIVWIGMWSTGGMGDARHVEICWTSHAPQNQFDSLDNYYRNPARKRDAFRHIEGNWYLHADW
jgi:hypothetical protein